MVPPHTQEYEDAITVTPVSSHTYTANLSPGWVIGTVPHGGYSMAVLYRLATTHFKHTHPSRHDSDPMPISMQMTFLRRTAVGPALLTVRDLKLGARTSTIYVTLSQRDAEDAAASSSSREKEEKADKIVGIITVSSPAAEVGLSAPTDWALHPAPWDARPPQLLAMTSSNQDEEEEVVVPGSPWKKVSTPYPRFRLVNNHSRVFAPAVPAGGHGRRRGIVEQWALLRPRGPKGGRGRWTNDTLAHLADLYPTALGHLDRESARSSSGGESSPSWYPTVTLNIDFKKRLPPEGVEWMYSRVVTKSVRNGRTDFEVVMMDETGDLVALATQIGLIVSESRNLSGRSMGNSGTKETEKVARAKI